MDMSNFTDSPHEALKVKVEESLGKLKCKTLNTSLRFDGLLSGMAMNCSRKVLEKLIMELRDSFNTTFDYTYQHVEVVSGLIEGYKDLVYHE